jgi:hypothetical protein
MATVNIHNFLYNKLAIQRRRGPVSYTIFFWDVPSQIWRPVVADLNPLFHHQSSSQPQPASGNITLTPWIPPHTVRGSRYQRPVLCTGKFLKTLTTGGQAEYIPVVTLRVPVPQSLKKREYLSVDPAEPVLQDVNLYTVRSAAPAPAPAPKPPKPIKSTPLTPIPKRIALLITEDACKREESCPISMEVLTVETTAVTTCFHTFNQDAIAGWFAQSDSNTCPVCRATCEVTQVC